jgi:acetyl esterase/lipase
MQKTLWIPIVVCSLIRPTLSGQDEILSVWPGIPPGGLVNTEVIESMDEDQPFRIRNVTEPSLSVYLPKNRFIDRTAIIICPGGGYIRLAFDHEGFEVAEWLNQQGIAGIVLKYRLPDDRIMENKSIGPLQDVQQAIRIVRKKAVEWQIDPNKIGVMGSSAGGHLAATASTLYGMQVNPSEPISARPDFSVLLYPVISFRDSVTHNGSRLRLLGDSMTEARIHQFSADEQVTVDTPPAFLIHSLDDDAVPYLNSLLYMTALRRNSVRCELHLFQSGGHGYGISRARGSEGAWPILLKEWLKMNGWL